ncbi:MAG: DNA polymerase III subunit beta [Desulfamplus sp.]|nr:DNA polymerase III subunit beta [Desulfamplus sp.]MBF0412527.1 DNA polymerase III subunit beta [Desulfamplus sp.]
MKFSIERKIISEALSMVQGLTNRKTTLAITSDVLIKAEGSYITVTANDLETVFQGKYEAEVESDGIISISAKKMFEIVRDYPESIIPLNEVENRWVEIGSGNIQYHIVSSDYENFPEHPVIEDIQFVEMESAALKKMAEISASINFSQDEKRPYVIGALLEKTEIEAKVADSKEGETDENQSNETSDKKSKNTPVLRMVSTDSKRLYTFDTPYSGDLPIDEKGIIIPKKGLAELGKFLSNVGTVKVGIKNNHFIVTKDDESIMIKLLEGDYPDYRRVLNIRGFVPIEMNRVMFLMMMKRMSILVSDDYKSVILSFMDNKLIATVTNPEIGESKEEIAIGYVGESVESAFNPKYFIDALSAFKGDNIVVNIKDKRNPCIIKGSDDISFVCAIMAMSI